MYKIIIFFIIVFVSFLFSVGVIGWRSYTRFIYNYHGDEMIKMNKFQHSNKLPKSWYKGGTKIKIIEDMIFKVHKYAYLHHIERLMIMGNIGL